MRSTRNFGVAAILAACSLCAAASERPDPHAFDCRGRRPAIRAGRSVPLFPTGASGYPTARVVRLVRQLLCADPQRRAVRSVPLGRRAIPADAGSRWTGCRHRLRLRRRPHRGLGTIRIDARSATALRDPSVRHVAIANPAHAPYGRAAKPRCGPWASTIACKRNWCSAKISRSFSVRPKRRRRCGNSGALAGFGVSARGQGDTGGTCGDVSEDGTVWRDSERFRRGPPVSRLADGTGGAGASAAIRFLPARELIRRLIWTIRPSGSACGSRLPPP